MFDRMVSMIPEVGPSAAGGIGHMAAYLATENPRLVFAAQDTLFVLLAAVLEHVLYNLSKRARA